MPYLKRFLSLGLLTLLAGCLGETGAGNKPASGAICQDGETCCEKDELVCAGNPDSELICSCFKDWDCETAVDPEKCWQNRADTPDGETDWTCQTQGNVEQCVRPGSTVPPGKNGWTCKQTANGVECSRPTNTPDGSSEWSCSYSGEFKSCTKGTPTPQPDGGVTPSPDSGVPPAGDLGLPPGWNCTTNANNELVCTKDGAGMPSQGAPGGGGSFNCFWKNNVITCEGSSPTPPGDGEWNCVQNELVGGWRCTKPVKPGDMPDGNGEWTCYSGTPFGGTVCVKSPPTQQGAECVPGTKKWCDGNAYCGWGQVTCGADGKWKTKVDPKTGKTVLDCAELADGRRPNTKCACHFYYWNKDCCETPDCIVPPGTNGQLCPASPGKYCDYCNPLKPECKNAGSKCIVTSNNETYCGLDCSGGKPCPTGASCQKLQVDSQYVWQCVPTDLSCYY